MEMDAVCEKTKMMSTLWSEFYTVKITVCFTEITRFVYQ